MTKISCVQVGDIHYPEWDPSHYGLDDKDKALSQATRLRLSFEPLREILDRLRRVALAQSTDAMIFMGDFTSRGLEGPLRGALNHFSWLCKADRTLESKPRLLLVPGNHDVSRMDALQLGQIAKFDKMSQWAKESLWYPPPVETYVHVEITGSTGERLHVFLVNTTLGSWERYALPKALQSVIDTGLADDAMLTQQDSLELEAAGAQQVPPLDYYDQLDTPYVSAKCLNELRTAIDAVDRRDAIMVVGHHNILPQQQPRLSSYAEMLNAGFFRHFLLSLDRPIVYLHGHTHTEVAEEIINPRNRLARVLSISAPKVEQGFNEISFHFDGRRAAVGVRILPWRLAADRGNFRAAVDDQVVANLQNSISLEPSKEARELYAVLPEGRYSLDDIVENLTENKHSTGSREVDSIALELFFWQWLDIDYISKRPADWRITKTKRLSA